MGLDRSNVTQLEQTRSPQASCAQGKKWHFKDLNVVPEKRQLLQITNQLMQEISVFNLQNKIYGVFQLDASVSRSFNSFMCS